MRRYIDLIGQITERLDVPYGNIRLGIHEALAYLDDHPELTGRTITASEFDEAVESCITEDATVPPHKFAERLGVVCVPDPKATMTTNPYTPDEAELIGCYAGAMEEQAGENYATAKADAERGIAKIKADAALTAVEKVLELHQPEYLIRDGEWIPANCTVCEPWTWPCKTVLAVEGASE